MSQKADLNFVIKALPTLVNEHVFAKTRELGFNEAVGCLDFAINFPTIVDEVMKRITKLPFIFYTHPKSCYEVPKDFVKFEDMPTIPKPPHVSLSSHEIAKLHDYRKKWLEAVTVATVRSETTKHKFTTLPIALYATEPPQNANLDLSLFLIGGHTPVSLARKVLFYNGTVFHKSSKENEVLMVAREDIFDVGSPITADIFIQDRDNSLHFSWSCTKPAVSIKTFVAISIELHCSVEGAVREGITLTEDQFEELQTVRQDIPIEPTLTVTKVTTNWKNKLASATCLHVRVAAGGSSSRKISRLSLTIKQKVKLLKSAFEPSNPSCRSLSRFL